MNEAIAVEARFEVDGTSRPLVFFFAWQAVSYRER